MATIATGGAGVPAMIANVYTGMEHFEKVRLRYNELESMRLPPEEITKETLKYAAQVGLMHFGGKYASSVLSKGLLVNSLSPYSKFYENAIKDGFEFLFLNVGRNGIPKVRNSKK